MNLLLVLFGMLASPLLLNWRLVRATLARLEVRRKLPKSVSAGELLVVELDAVNPRRRLGSWAVAAEDVIQREGGDTQPAIAASVLFSHVPAGQSRRETYRGRLMQRGRYRFGPLRISTRFPFGLVRMSTTLDQPQTLLVHPRLGRLTRRWQRLHLSADLGASRVQRKQGLLEGDFYGLRDWRTGDSRRWIHWRTSARRQVPAVRQFEQRRNQDLALIVELWQPAEPTSRDRENVELAVSFAASIVSDLCRRGGRSLWVGLAAAAPRHVHGPASLGLAREVLESLAVAEGSSQDRLPEVVGAALDAIRPGTNTIVVSTRPVNWSDTERFATLWSNPRQRAWIGRIQWIDVGRPDLSDYFVPE
jgi:uncharacterized protein (DUF58 family)